MKSFVIAVCVVLLASSAYAQAPTSYQLKIFNQGATSPLTTTSLAASGFTCNQAPPDTTNVANPTKIAFDDPANAGKSCVFTDNGTGPLVALPFGTGVYVATLAVVNSAGTSPDSAVSNSFTRPGTTANAPVAVRVFR